MTNEKEFNKYRIRGSMHWLEMMSRDPRIFNAYQQARYDWIMRIAGDIRGKKVLDLGCGDGPLTYLLAKAGGDVVGVDNEEQGLKFAEENLKPVAQNLKYEFVRASAYELPFDDNTWDLVVNCEVIEHLQEPERMLTEVSRVLKKGGRFILTTPYRITEMPQDANHVREYFPGEIQLILEKYLAEVNVRPTHHALWYSLYTYAVRCAGSRPLGRWFINIPALLFGWNPFLADYGKLTKFDRFTTILAWGSKK